MLIHFNDQFATLPESDKGYEADITIYRENDEQEFIRVRSKTINVPAELVAFAFLSNKTADHEVKGLVLNQEELTKIIVKECNLPVTNFNQQYVESMWAIEVFFPCRGPILLHQPGTQQK